MPGDSHAHSHEHVPSGAVRVAPAVRVVTMVLLALIAAGTALGLILLWPDSGKVEQLAERAQLTSTGMSYQQGEIVRAGGDCPGTPGEERGGAEGQGAQPSCEAVSVRVLTGRDEGALVDLQLRGGLAESGLRVGDRIELIAYEAVDYPGTAPEGGGQPGAGSGGEETLSYEISTTYDVSGVLRNLPLLLLAILFAVVVVAVGRFRGLLGLVALGVSAGVLLLFVLPALVAGGPGLLIGIVGSSAIMFVILYFVHGPNMRATAALIGTLCGILIMAGISFIAVHTTRLSGVGDEASGLLSTIASEIDFRGMLSCAIIIAGLGVLNDVTITQASAVWELRAAAPSMPRHEIYRRAMRIGRHHLASTVYTVFFAYVGAAMSVLILLFLYDRPMLSMLSREDIATEVVRTLCGSIGLVLAIPITTAVATLFVPPSVAPPAGSSPKAERDTGWEAEAI